jgi:hypothetical protein
MKDAVAVISAAIDKLKADIATLESARAVLTGGGYRAA